MRQPTSRSSTRRHTCANRPAGQPSGTPRLEDGGNVARVRFPPPPLFGSTEPIQRSASGGTIPSSRWEEKVLVRLGRSPDVGEVAAEKEPELREYRPAEREHPFLRPLP